VIAGVGIDLVSLPEFEEQLLQPASAFLRNSFSASEIADCTESNTRTQRLGARYAAKEAFIKAWSGARIGHRPDLAPAKTPFNAIEIRNDDYGRPFLVLRGTVKAAVAASLGPVDAQLSMAHEPTFATAIVTLTRVQDTITLHRDADASEARWDVP
jgi:holo-[acyl-carrier protein] synthase